MNEQDFKAQVTGDIPLSNMDPIDHAKFIRLCIFLNVLHTVYYLVFNTRDRNHSDPFDIAIHAGHNLVFTVLIAGILKEGADAIRDASPLINKAIKNLGILDEDRSVAEDSWKQILSEMDKSVPTSLWNQHLKHIRDSAAFHWSRDGIQRACELQKGKLGPYQIARFSDDINCTRYVLADEILGRLAFPHAVNHSDIDPTLMRMQQFSINVIKTLGLIVVTIMRTHGADVHSFDEEHWKTAQQRQDR